MIFFTFYKYRNIKEFAKRSFGSKRSNLIEFKDELELFYIDTIEIKPNKGYELHDKPLNIYKTDKLTR